MARKRGSIAVDLDPDKERTDDMSTNLQMTQFMDEWYCRCVHAGLANEWDRQRCSLASLEVFELLGVKIAAQEKQRLSELDDDDLNEAIVKRMPEETRKVFEHVALQLQLVMSAASRVRCAMEDGLDEEVAHIMEEGDQGVNAQIIKQILVEATGEVTELKAKHEKWDGNMTKRFTRLTRAANEAEAAAVELEKLNLRLGSFSTEQNSKAKGVLLGIAAKGQKELLTTVFRSWWGWKVKYKAEEHIHKKFQKMIDDATDKLMMYKQKNVNNVRGVLSRNAESSGKALKLECFRVWAKDTEDSKDNRELKDQMESAKTKMDSLKAVQKDNAQKTMARLCAGAEESLRTMSFQAWALSTQDTKKNAKYMTEVKAQEERMKKFQTDNNQRSKAVIERVTGGSDTGLLQTVWKAWFDEYAQSVHAKELDSILSEHQQKFVNMNSQMKERKNATTERANDMEDEVATMVIFMNWATEAKLGRLVQHYSGQMDSKKQQLEAVQSMFKSFATQLEQGISTTPRTTRKSARSGSQSRPPQMPSPGGDRSAAPATPAAEA
mmetsp:Transcript_57624/g.129942  ORF Transcript_57624/g.129942 Transcript_57624/m.129942 type:complete len:551 (+) Transcript_57624:69-1721(+)